MKDERLEKLAKVLVEYSTNVKKGDKVAISGEDVSIPFLKAVAKEVIEKGAIVEYYVDVPEVDAIVLKDGEQEQYARENCRFGDCVRSDVWISAWGTQNTKTFHHIDGERLKERRLANKENRKLYSKRVGDGSLRWCGTQFPTYGDAQQANMSLEEYEEFVYQAGGLYAEDPIAKWKEREAMQERWVQYLDTKKELHILAEGRMDMKVNIAGRKWVNCCGKENFPDGEIFTSPVEDDINGFIIFSYPSIMNGHEFENVRLEVRKGRVEEISCDNKADLKQLISYFDTDEGSRFFGEMAIGTNYDIKRHTKNILFDEKIGGSIHMAIGESFPEAGGKNESAIHWDLITDMQEGGKIYADGELFYEKGQFLESVLQEGL